MDATAAPVPDAITVRNLSKAYPTDQGKLAVLRNVSFRARTGEFVAIIGPSGCGKSTLLRLIGDLEESDRGEICVLGQSPAAARLARRYALVFQSPTLLEWRTVKSNLELPLEIAGLGAAERSERAAQALELLRLGRFGKAYPGELSAGMQMQVALARALVLQPQLLLMDEPFGALDELTRERLGLELQSLWLDRRMTVLFVTHNLSEAVLLSDRVVVLSPRPGTVTANIEIDLARPRQLAAQSSTRFWELVGQVRASLEGADRKGEGEE